MESLCIELEVYCVIQFRRSHLPCHTTSLSKAYGKQSIRVMRHFQKIMLFHMMQQSHQGFCRKVSFQLTFFPKVSHDSLEPVSQTLYNKYSNC